MSDEPSEPSTPTADAPDPAPPGFRDYAAIFLVSAAIMLYRITLTRVLSVVVWYHFAFLVISMVMLGLGAPGVWFAMARRPLRLLKPLLLVSALAVPISIALVVQFGAAMMEASAAYLALSVLPATLSLGGVVCLLLMKATGPSVGRMYGADLLGAGLAAVLIIPLMTVLPTPAFAVGTAFLPLIALALYGGAMRKVAAVLAVIIIATLAEGSAYQVTRSKGYDEAPMRPLYEKWSPTARITVFDENFFLLKKQKEGFLWGRGRNRPKDAKPVKQYWLEQDGAAGMALTEFSGDLDAVSHLLYDVTTVGHQLRPPERVAVIGAGGGRDVLSSLLAGATDIDAVELNATTIDTVTNRFGDVSGDIYNVPGVNAVASEGRSHLTHTDKSFDLIQISLIDSWAASAAGAFALAENNLYTVEAFQLYAERLTPDGMISTSRWTNEIPRLVVLVHSALESLGIEEPRNHMAIVAAGKASTLLTSLKPFGSGELARLDAICEERGFDRLYPVPLGEEPKNAFIAETVTNGLEPMARMGLNVTPPTDDNPYFFHLFSPFASPNRLGLRALELTGLDFNLQSTLVLQQIMLGVVGLALAFFFLPFLMRVGRRGRAEPLGHMLRATFYFALIGAAFMLLENVLLQRFVLYLGHPSYATTVIIAGLLMGMGAGAMGADRFGVKRLKTVGLLVPLVLLALVYGLLPLFAATIGLPIAARVLITCVILVPLGALLGLFFPLGMLRFGDNSKPWYWAINGIFGVVASVFSLALSIDFGFTTVGLVAAGGYLLAVLCLGGSSATRTS